MSIGPAKPRRSPRALWAIALAGALATGCVGDGNVPTQLSGWIVGDDESPIGPGLVLIERGPVHAGAYETGALIGPDGSWSATLPETDEAEGQLWGIHLFHDDYQYLPLEVRIQDRQHIVLTSPMVAWGQWLDLTGQPTWPDQPADPKLVRLPIDDEAGDNPTLSNLKIAYDGPLVKMTIDAADPDGDLSRMILGFDPATGTGFAFNPPSAPDGTGNYPNGTYTFQIFFDEAVHVAGESVLYFIVSDNLCNNSPILRATLPPR